MQVLVIDHYYFEAFGMIQALFFLLEKEASHFPFDHLFFIINNRSYR